MKAPSVAPASGEGMTAVPVRSGQCRRDAGLEPTKDRTGVEAVEVIAERKHTMFALFQFFLIPLGAVFLRTSSKRRAHRIACSRPMKQLVRIALIVAALLAFCELVLATGAGATATGHPLFDGQTLNGWEGDPRLWRVEDGAITGGSLTETIRRNEFLCTTNRFTNFVLRCRIKLTGKEGFINSGIQVRSERVPNNSEVAGYQCDFGDPDWWGAIYDEARRNKVLFPTDMIALEGAVRRGDWNDYMIRADGPRLTVWLNGVRTADYYEDDPAISDHGVIGFQVHGGGKALVQVKDLTIEELPPRAKFIGAGQPAALPHASPLTPAEQRATFSLPPGFDIELVASEEQGVGKPITVTWDAAGRMWTMTAFEYPVDANDNKEIAEALYQQPRRDKVLVFDNAFGPGPHTPRVFAEGFAIPLGVLPYKDGAFVQHGSEILFLRDTNGDGRADSREAVLTGFGIGDSHLMPHQFTRAPGGWIYVAQGAFNNSNVRTKSGDVTEFNRTLLGRFTPDGARFETIGWGPCNIWGLVLDGQGEVFIQEANDYGYPIMPFHVGAFYPGCTPAPKSYVPVFPGLSRLGMGGTGLSGLALSDARGAFPGAYADVFFVANPVTQRIQAVKLEREGGHYSLVKLPDFVRTADEWFRPVAIHFGPDGCLYIVDWYNKVISHNEVPRNHPDRDKTRGRIWRVRHKDQTPHRMPDLTKANERELVSLLGGDSLPQAHLAWQQIIDRNAVAAAPALERLLSDANQSAAARLQALWALEGLHRISTALLQPLLRDPNRNVRREAIRAFGAAGPDPSEFLVSVEPLMTDPDPEVRAEVIRSSAPFVGKDPRALAVLLRMAREPLTAPLARSPQNGRPMKVREAYDRDFERYLVRATLEKHPQLVSAFLAGDAARDLPIENRLLAALAVEPRQSAPLVAALLPQLQRAPGEEELLRLAQFIELPSAGEALKAVLRNPATRTSAAESLLRGRTRLDTARLNPLVAEASSALLKSDDASRELALRLAAGFKLASLEPEIIAGLTASGLNDATQAAMLRTLRELGSANADLFARYVVEAKTDAVRTEALTALASSPTGAGVARLFALWSRVPASQRRLVLERLASSKTGAEAMIASARQGVLPRSELDSAVLDKALAVLGETAELRALLDSLGSVARPVLRLDGKPESYVSTKITLDGPFTVETWIRLDPGIGNEDGILGRPGGADFNFYDGRFRIYGGPAHGDRIIAKRKMTPELWTHVAATRDDTGNFKIYINGELDTAECRPLQETFTDLDIGRVAPKAGPLAWLAEYRVWNRCRGSDEIRADFDRSYEGEPARSGLVRYFPGGGPWERLHGTARVVRTLDVPPLLTATEAQAQAEKFARFHTIAEASGDAAHGKQIASGICLNCHTIQGQGANIGPNLSGAGAMNLEAMLRSILTPNAAMEAGYRVYRVEVEGDEVLDAFFVSEDKDAVVVRMPNSEDRRIPKREIRRAGFIRRSLMPEGLLEAMPDQDARDLLSYLRTLK